MTKTNFIREEMVKSMKAKDKARKDALSMLLGALRNEEINKRRELTDAEADVIIKKEIKQTQETYDVAPESRSDIKAEATYRISVYKEFVEEDMSEEQLRNVISETLSDLDISVPTKSDMGKIMKVLMPKVKGKADGKIVNSILATMIK